MAPPQLRLTTLLVVPFLLAGAAAAQQPFVVDDAEVTPSGIWHLEVSNHVDWLRTSARPARWQNTMEWEVDYGLTGRLEAACLVPLISISNDHATGRTFANGVGDTAFGLKYRFPADPDARHAFAGSASIELPTGSRARGTGSGLIDYGFNFVSQHRLTGSATVRTNGGFVLAGNTQTGAVGIRERGTVLTAGSSLVGRVGARWLVGGELTLAWSQKATLGGSFAGWQVGANLTLRDGVSLDVGVLGGWLAASPRAGVQVGASIDLSR